jgi:ElaB/YqjD/DUF883 family membrane-anchored ribosome-binding protein
MGQVPDDLDEIGAVAAEVDGLRERTQSIVVELERRLRARAARVRDGYARVRHAVDVRAHIAEHPRVAIGIGAVTALALGLAVWLAVARAREARRPMNRLRGRMHAYRALLADPERALHPRPSLGKTLLTAVLVAGATSIVRGLGIFMLARSLSPPRGRPPTEEQFV